MIIIIIYCYDITMPARSRRPRRKQARRPRRRIPRNIASGLGGMTCYRKCGLLYMRNSVLANTVASTGVVNNNLVLGTPEICPYGATNIFNVPFAMSFSLSQVVNPLEFSSLFERYKILGVSITLKCNTNYYPGNSVFNALPAIHYVPDYDDATPQTIAAFRQRQHIKRQTFDSNRLCKLSVKPKMSSLVYNTALTNGYEVSAPRWLDTDYRDVPHFGIKGFIEDMNLASTINVDQVFTFDITLKLAFKDLQ